MNFKEYMKDKNVLTIDTWAGFLILILSIYGANLIKIPQFESNKPILSTELITFMSIDVLGLIIFGTICIIYILMCSHLRKYRYFDMYLQCKKIRSKTANIVFNILIIFEFFALIFVFWFIILEIPLLVLIYIMIHSTISLLVFIITSVKFNNSKDLK